MSVYISQSNFIYYSFCSFLAFHERVKSNCILIKYCIQCEGRYGDPCYILILMSSLLVLLAHQRYFTCVLWYPAMRTLHPCRDHHKRTFRGMTSSTWDIMSMRVVWKVAQKLNTHILHRISPRPPLISSIALPRLVKLREVR